MQISPGSPMATERSSLSKIKMSVPGKGKPIVPVKPLINGVLQQTTGEVSESP